MVEEIMELSEMFATAFMVAAKDFHISLGLRIFVFVDGELFGGRHLVVNLYLREIKVFSLYFFNFNFIGNKISYSFVQDLAL